MATDLRIHRLVASVFSAGRTVATRTAASVEQIHDDHADFVFRSLQRLGVRERDLEDAMQDVFIVVHRKLHTFDDSARMSTWLYGICLRVAASYRRRAHVRRERATDILDDTPDEDPARDPEAAVLARESEERLRRALDALRPEKRAVLVMFEIEGLSANEISEMIGIPVGTVHSRLFAARAEFVRAVAQLDLREKGGKRR